MDAGLTHATINAFEEPPKESISNIVNLESLYGMYGTFVFLSDKALITFPRVNKDLLILPVYLAIYPWDLDYLSLSLPAKSTKVIFPYLLTLLLYTLWVSLII